MYFCDILISEVIYMQMVLYTNNSDNRTLSKSLTEISTVEMTLKNDTGIMNPVIILSGGSIPPIANYAYISALNRYYYITGQRIIPGKMLEISLKEDVLMSWRVFLTQHAQVIAERSTNVPNKKLPDNVPVLANRNVIYKKFKGASEGFGSQNITANSRCYCLTVLNGNVKLDPPAQLRLKSDGLNILVFWDRITGAISYVVQYQLDGAVEWNNVNPGLVMPEGAVFPVSAAGLYHVRVAGTDGLGNIISNYATSSIQVVG